MAHLVVKDPQVLFDKRDISGHVSQTTLNYEAEIVDDTVGSSDSVRRKLSGLKNITMVHEALYDSAGDDPLDAALFNAISGGNQVITVSPDGGAADEVAYIFQADLATYSPGASIGEVLAISASAEGHGVLVRGKVLHAATVGSSAASSPLSLGAVGASQSVYGALHVLSMAGSSASVSMSVQSASSSGFSSPSTRLAFTAATTTTAEWKSASGAITDTWWRAKWKMSGTTAVQFTVSAGIK